MLNELRGLLNYVGRKADAQRQREAMVDLLIWTMYADNLLALPENDRIDQLTETMEWDAPTPASQYLKRSIAKVRDAIDDEEKAELLMNGIYERLGTEDMRRSAYAACRDLARVDGEVAEEETDFLNSIKERFDIVDDK